MMSMAEESEEGFPLDDHITTPDPRQRRLGQPPPSACKKVCLIPPEFLTRFLRDFVASISLLTASSLGQPDPSNLIRQISH